MSQSAFTGRHRRRKTRPTVKVIDRVSRAVITVGGIGTILAVILILVFLVYVVAPLFTGAEVEAQGDRTLADPPAGRPLRMGLDEHHIMSWSLARDGTVTVRRVDDGTAIATRRLGMASPIRVISVQSAADVLALGLEDGTVVTGRIGFDTTFFEPHDEDVPERLRELPPGAVESWGEGLVEMTPAGQLRRQEIHVELDPPFDPGGGAAIVAVDHTAEVNEAVTAVLTEDGTLHVHEVKLRPNHMTGKVRRKVRTVSGAIVTPEGLGRPRSLVLSGLADNAYVVWPGGHLVRYAIHLPDPPVEAERVNLLGGETATVTCLAALVGKSSILVGDDRGRLRTWFLASSPTQETIDKMSLVEAHDLPGGHARITALAPSSRTRIVAVGDAEGSVRLFHITSHKLLCEVRVENQQAIDALAISPGEGLLSARAGDILASWGLDVGHPEATFGALFGRVLYEGHAEPRYEWQSDGASDSFEPKLSLVPLIFGTLKATLYSMMFAVPLALLAAIYTSEFLSPKVRPRVKSVVEVMASLPSVVLGFLAALVLAPFIERVVPAVLLAFLTIPFVLALAAHLWQLLPRETTLSLERLRLGFVTLAIPLGLVGAFLLGPVVERAFFSGDIKLWLDGKVGPAGSGSALLLLPFMVVVVALVFARLVTPRARGMSEGGAARFALLRLVVVCGVGLLLALAAGHVLGALGVDPRPGVMATYVQRNAMVVGIAMGFAVIPIIYTIAEDALSSVPEHLRAASLGAGATPWQTATRVIVPTAASGLFSACMIGLGRAVGETMIVLMAAGNTALMDWNPFNGFRTLSANIAVEMPEAVKDSTHYRLLFLAGLVLFAMTFVVNTVAEVIRIRFRRRAFQL